jgi:hypothetical protein
MPQRWPSLDQIQHLQELNRLFLSHLQSCSFDVLDEVGFPAAARTPLRTASPEVLDAIAQLPRALFELRLSGETAAPPPRDPRAGRVESARQALNLTILLWAWTLSRQSVYQARLLLGLESRSIQQLRGLPLGALQWLACAPSLLVCAFGAREWLWSQLISATEPQVRQRLALIALQPGLERDWPLRRVAQHP